MKKFWMVTISLLLFGGGVQAEGLGESFKGIFWIGTALNERQITGRDSLSQALVAKHFSSIVAENCMKSEVIHPSENTYNFDLSDQMVALGMKHNQFIVGHTLIWHSQLARWFTVDQEGETVSKEVLIERMKAHITTIVSRYKGKVKGWDVVNEAINDDGSFRQTPFYNIIGEDYIRLAFEFAHAADPDAELYYNDYSMANEAKRNAVVAMVRKLKQQGVRIDAVGMQGHMSLTYPTLEAFEKSILAFTAEGVKVSITEWDMSVLPEAGQGANVADRVSYQEKMNPYTNGLPAEVAEAWNQRMQSFIQLFLKYKSKISRITWWGVLDSDSWKNNWPMRGRTDFPLLFDRNYQPKPLVNWMIQLDK